MPEEFVKVVVEPDIKDWLRSWGRQGDGLMVVVEAAVDDLADEAQALYKQTVGSWDNRPTFTITKQVTAHEVTAKVGTDSLIYKYVDEGTRSRDIVPRSAGGVLVFRAEYTPRTRPGSLSSGAKRSSGPLIFTKRVRGHSIKARRFTPQVREKVQEKVRPVLSRRMKEWEAKFK